MSEASEGPTASRAGYVATHLADAAASGRAARSWWDAEAQSYLAEHGDFLGDADLRWGPEGLREGDAHLLGDLSHLRTARVLEIGAGAAHGSRWLRSCGVDRVLATDISAGMLARSRELDARTGVHVPVVQADARALPLARESVDVAFTSYGALPFVPDPWRVHAEVARVLVPGGRWVFSHTHPVRWAFPDVPGEAGLTVHRSYFDRRPYAEHDERGMLTYAEHHRTLGDVVADLTGAGFVLRRLVEPTWPEDLTQEWGGWSPLRGRVLPGTAVWVCERA